MANSDNPNPTLARHPTYGKLLNIGQTVEEKPEEQQAEEIPETKSETNND